MHTGGARRLAAVLWPVAFLLPLHWPGLRAARWSLPTGFLMVFWPRGGDDRMRREQERRFRDAALPLFGLPDSFTGDRHLAGSRTAVSWRHWRGYEVRRLSLGHGDLRQHPDVPWLTAETAHGQSAPAASEQRRRLAERIWCLEPMVAYRAEGRLPESWQPFSDRPDPLWSTARIEIDGAPVLFEHYTDGTSWVARAAYGEYVVSVLASGLPVESVRLLTVTDIEPYVEGSRLRNASPVCIVPPVSG